jgi:hypothetical protein
LQLIEKADHHYFCNLEKLYLEEGCLPELKKGVHRFEIVVLFLRKINMLEKNIWRTIEKFVKVLF